MAKKALLMILDGWGIGNKGKGDVIYQTPTPNLDKINAKYPHSHNNDSKLFSRYSYISSSS